MFGFVGNIINAVFAGPRNFVQQKFKLPLIKFVDDSLDVFKARARTGIYTTRDVLLKGTVVAFITTLLVWLSVFMYLAFYFTYVPSIAHERPVHLTFKSTDDPTMSCATKHSHLIAHIELTKRQQLLMKGQPYKIYLDLEMPESPTNKELGMFVICADFYGKGHTHIAESCRSSMLHYRSPLLEILYTVVYSPFFLLGSSEEKQHLHIELFSNYEEHGSESMTDVQIEIEANKIELYSAKFLINAEFTGLRYYMFNWPLLSAALGVTSNLFVIAIISLISWYQILHSEEYKKYVEKKQKKVRPEIVGSLDDDSYSSSSIEDISMMEKYRDKSSDSDVAENAEGKATNVGNL